MSALISLLVLVVIFGIVYWVVQQIPLPPPIRLAVIVIFAVIAIVWLLKFFGGFSGLHFAR
jgi:hypothetical protein